ncbi:hypothetical protein [Massilia sp. PWRC2]|uniref:hypothetical protein n=1 Tax=Massilia sp. PWRC2 TaxID=2804626 RepID=UPI003CEC8A02
MSARNPEFKNVDRPAYELPALLQRLGTVSFYAANTAEQRQIAEAARDHARNLQSNIAAGIDSIGHLLYSSALGDTPPNADRLQHVGLLISHLAVQLEHSIDAAGEMDMFLDWKTEKNGAAK